MDTISRENNSMLPVGGIVVGAIGLLLGVIALVKVSGVSKTVTENQPRIEKIADVEAQATSAAQSAQKVAGDLKILRDTSQAGFDSVFSSLGALQTSVTRIEEMAKKPVPAPSGDKKGSAPAVAGPGEYVVKPQDSFAKIARANGTTITALEQVNPGVSSSSLKIGQKIKLPKK